MVVEGGNITTEDLSVWVVFNRRHSVLWLVVGWLVGWLMLHQKINVNDELN
jgi:hypothetical protein